MIKLKRKLSILLFSLIISNIFCSFGAYAQTNIKIYVANNPKIDVFLSSKDTNTDL